MDVGSRIKYFRNKRNLSVNKLANLSGVSQSFLRDIELGNKQPTVEYLEYICFGLGITLKEFFDADKAPSEIEMAIEKLTTEQKKKLIEFINTI
ncbi:MAG: helix-turn-helix transcriptional regulator [Clostridia bacterium]|nr:helix-turn-helix transcriptional regulator [Clostridia bacterium]